MNLNINAEPVTGGADSSILGWFPDQIFVYKNRTYTVVSAPDKIGLICMPQIQIIFGTVCRKASTAPVKC